MVQKHNSIAMWKKRLIAEISRDKKKAVTLGLLLLVAIFFIGKLLLKSSPTEATAAANPTAIASPGAPVPPGAENTAARIHSAESPRVNVPKGAAKGITRDIFRPDESIFPHVEKTASANSKVNVVEDEKSKRDAELRRKRELIREQGAELHLKSTITGRVPTAIINGTVLGLDGVINGFRIVKIESKVCVVEKEGITLNLTME